MQWKKAARGIDGRAYPWGLAYVSGYANINETYDKVGPHYLKCTSPVGMYLQGKSPYGVLDMSGNVLEWCLNEYKYPQNTQLKGDNMRALRGGSWYHIRNLARVAHRFWSQPIVRTNHTGFRVVSGSVPHI